MNRTSAVHFIFISGLVFSGAPLGAQTAVGGTKVGQSLLPAAEFHAGETVRYAFAEQWQLTTTVNPAITGAKLLPGATSHAYGVEGEVTAQFAPSSPGEPLHGAARFQNLRIKDWVSSSSVADLEARFRQLEAAPLSFSMAPDGNFDFSGGLTTIPGDAYGVDILEVESLAKFALIGQISEQPVKPGDRVQEKNFPVHGISHPEIMSLHSSTSLDYLADVSIGERRFAQLQLTRDLPRQLTPEINLAPAASEGKFKTIGEDRGRETVTYLYDPARRAVAFFHLEDTSDTGVSLLSTDENSPVRIPVKVFDFTSLAQVNLRVLGVGASALSDTDLASFEKSLQPQNHAAAGPAATSSVTSLSGEVSLGELARRLRAEHLAEGSAPNEITLQGSGASADSAPPGFKLESVQDGGMTVLVPAQASEDQRTHDVIHLHVFIDSPRNPVIISMGVTEANNLHSIPPDVALDEVVKGLRQRPGFSVLKSEHQSIHGKPGIVIEVLTELEQGKPFQELMGNVISGDKGFAVTCGTLPAIFPRVESLCRTVVESIRIP